MSGIDITEVTVIRDQSGNCDWSGADRRCVDLDFIFADNKGNIIQLEKCGTCIEYEKNYPQEDKQWACLFCTPKK